LLYFVPRVEALPNVTDTKSSGASKVSSPRSSTSAAVAANAAADQKLIVRRRTDTSIPCIANGNAATIRWEESFYLNVVLHHMTYILTVSIHTTDGYALVKKVDIIEPIICATNANIHVSIGYNTSRSITIIPSNG
jgi:hypothetical protein